MLWQAAWLGPSLLRYCYPKVAKGIKDGLECLHAAGLTKMPSGRKKNTIFHWWKSRLKVESDHFATKNVRFFCRNMLRRQTKPLFVSEDFHCALKELFFQIVSA